MSEERKGRVKLSVEVELNEALMELMKETMAKMPEVLKHARERRQA